MSNDPFKEKEVLPTTDNLLEAFKIDSVNRVNYVFSLYEMLNQTPYEVSSISIEGQWGSGKTFFIKMLWLLILAHTDNLELTKENKEDLRNRYKSYNKNGVKENNIFPVYYDAWKNDSMPSPVLSLVYSICKQVGLKNQLRADTEKTIKSILKAATKLSLTTLSVFSGTPDTSGIVDPICELFGPDSRFVPIIDTETLEKDVKSLINKIAEAKNKTLVIFIDELDRCKPTFAIQLLEAIKHYFYTPKILFVLSANIEELQHSIKCVYGQGFDATRYLDRFFNIRFHLPAVDSNDFLKKQFPKDNVEDVLSVMICGLAKIYNLQLRSLIKFKTQVRFVANYELSQYGSDKFEYGRAFVYWIFVPIAICLKFHDQSQFEAFISGKGYDTLSYLSKQNNLEIRNICTKFLKNENESKSTFNLLSSLNKAYGAVFSKKASPEIGICIFDENCYQIFNDKVSLLG